MSSLENKPYGDLGASLFTRHQATRVPLNVTFEVTRRCPLNCQHCYNNLAMDDAGARAAELSYDEYVGLIDELADLGCLWLLFSGGEIFARRDFLDIYKYARQKGFLITLFTNGTLITERIADFLTEWRPFAIEITVYGRTAETYEALTGIPGSFEHCVRGIELLLERNLPLSLKTVAVRTNKHEVEAMKHWAGELGVEFKFDAMMSPRIDCSQSPLSVRLTPAEVVEFDVRDPERTSEWRAFAANAPGASTEGTIYSCGGGVNSFALDPVGNMSICVLSHADHFDVRKGSIREGWERFLYDVRRRPKTRPTKCSTCSLSGICGMCPANGELESFDPEEPVDFLCHVSHLRARMFDVAIQPHGDCDFCERAGQLDAEAALIAAGAVEIPMWAEAGTRAASCGQGCGGCGK